MMHTSATPLMLVSVILAGCHTVQISDCHRIAFNTAEYCDGPVTHVSDRFTVRQFEQCKASDKRTGCTAKVIAEINNHFGKSDNGMDWDMREKFYWRLGEWDCPEGISANEQMGSGTFQDDVLYVIDTEHCDPNTPLPNTPLPTLKKY